jgi:hypothetical protein
MYGGDQGRLPARALRPRPGAVRRVAPPVERTLSDVPCDNGHGVAVAPGVRGAGVGFVVGSPNSKVACNAVLAGRCAFLKCPL